ncbi:MAG TPA: DUF4433 domain-containing protein [Dokdonella sp.]|nr:DUF4433 domain-containing protein [Dokdonella sp.]
MTAIYHITHLDNLPGIIAQGGLLADTAIRQRALAPRSIAYRHIKDRRNRTPVPIAPGGCVSDYVPFYFCPRSPMLYAIQSGQVEGYPGGQTHVLHLLADAEAIEADGHACLHTDGNAASQPLTFHEGTGTLASTLSWDVIRSTSWGNTAEDNDRKRRKQAEFLVWQRVPWHAIVAIGVIDEATAQRARDAIAGAAHRPVVTVHRDWYYP